jgi:hypothetical protein
MVTFRTMRCESCNTQAFRDKIGKLFPEIMDFPIGPGLRERVNALLGMDAPDGMPMDLVRQWLPRLEELSPTEPPKRWIGLVSPDGKKEWNARFVLGNEEAEWLRHGQIVERDMDGHKKWRVVVGIDRLRAET